MINNILNDAIILAGGKGTRLANVLNGKPKPLVEIGGIPLLKHQVDLLIKFNINNIYLLVNYKANLIKKYLEDEYNNNINFIILEDGAHALGTGGSIIKHLTSFSDRFLVLYGDTFLNIDFDKFYKFHQLKKSDLTLFTHPNSHPYDSDIVVADSFDQVIGISGYPHDENFYSANLVNAALYIVEKKILESLPKLDKKIIDFAKDLIPLYLKLDKNVYSYKSIEYIKDCGTEDRLNNVEEYYSKYYNNIYDENNLTPSIFIDRDGTIIKNVDHLNSINQIKFLKNSLQAIKKFNLNNFLVSIVTNQPVLARGELSEQGLKDIHNYIEWEAGKEGAYFDEILYCPHHPHSGFEGEVIDLKIICNCRKPKTGMIQEFSRKYNIDKKESWFIGDSTADIKCGNDFGVNTILLETGFSGKDNKFLTEPDYIFKDLFTASTFINQDYLKLTNIAKSLKINEDFNNIFISGVSKSGKSTFSSVLKKFIERSFNVKCHIIRLDNYMLDLKDRGSFPNIYDNEKIKAIIRKRNEKKCLNIPTQRYDKFNRIIMRSNELIKIFKDDWVIFEGIITYNLTNNFFNKNQFYVECDEIKIKDRFKRDYINRGLKESSAIKLYEKRSSERTYIEEQKKKSKIIKL
jgi:histidinol-phosphate phosphatase family protein